MRALVVNNVPVMPHVFGRVSNEVEKIFFLLELARLRTTPDVINQLANISSFD